MMLTRNAILALGAVTLTLTLAMPAAAAAQDAALIKKGQDVYAAQQCSTCHLIAGKGGKPSALDGVGKKLTAADIRAWIVSPVEMTKKTHSTMKPPMPARYGKLPAGDLDALVAYMQSLK